MGGLPRRATFIEQERAEGTGILLVDSGNFIADKPLAEQALESAGAKAELILKAMDSMGYAAMAVGEKDLYLGIERLRSLDGSARVRFLSANLLDSSGKHLFDAHAIVRVQGLTVGLFGLTAPPSDRRVLERRMDKATVADPAEAAREAVEDLSGKCDLVVMLSNVGYAEDLALAESVPGIDIIVTGGTRRFMNRPVIKGGTLITSGYYEGRAVGRLGVHLDGAVEGWISLEERDYLDKQIEVAQTKMGTPAGKRRHEDLVRKRQLMERMTPYESRMVNLDPSIADEPKVTAWISEYRKGLTGSQGPAAAAVGQVHYTGAEACASCHEGRYRYWLTTDHSRAFESLAPKDAGADPDCLPCHVTGYMRPTGYWPRAPRETLRGVQCEACHGVGSLHISDADSYSLVHLPLAPQCLDCHTMEQDEEFDYSRDKGKVCAEI